MKHKKIFIPLIVLGSVVVALGGTIGVLNLTKFATYKEYYSIKTDVTKIPDINKGFVPQSLTLREETDTIIIGGYMSNKKPSRMYVIDKDYNSKMITFTLDGSPFYGHMGGLASTEDYVYIAEGDGKQAGVYNLDLTTVLDPSVTSIELSPTTRFAAVDGSASFAFADDEHLYVGEFYNNKYPCHHDYQTTTDGLHKAIVREYLKDDVTLSNPIKYISITDQVQGFAIGKDGDIILSTSYGLSASKYYVYKSSEVKDTGTLMDGVPLYTLENPYRVLKAPPMSEGIDFNKKDNKIYTITEFASNKYILGKLFGANKITALDF